MRKINIIAIASVVLLVLIAAIVLVVVIKNPLKKDSHDDILNCATKEAVTNYLEEKEIQSYSFDGDLCQIHDLSVLGTNASVDFLFDENATKQVSVVYPLFHCIDEDASEEELASFDIMSYQFTQEDKKKITEAFDQVKKSVESYLGCTFGNYDLVPTQNEVKIEDNEDKFYQGLLIREYSVRDASGMLWLLRYDASYGAAQATLIKVVDDSGYEGFVPSIDMTKK